MRIKKFWGHQILDSRGLPTIECILELDDATQIRASVPAGASVGKHEAFELRDCDMAHFQGKGVLRGVDNLKSIIAPILVGRTPDVMVMDRDIIELDGTEHKTKLGANAMLAASIAVVRAQAYVQGVELFRLLQELSCTPSVALPQCMFNVINGGMHADSGLVFQEFMLVPKCSGVRRAVELVEAGYQAIKNNLREHGASTAVGDEGGFAPRFEGLGIQREQAALKLLCDSMGAEMHLALDVAASCFYDVQHEVYRVHDVVMTTGQLIDLYEQLVAQYPIVSIEDGLDQDDWDGWKMLTKRLGMHVSLLGDDLFTTNIQRIQKGIDLGIANAVLIKPNQIGTVTETLRAINLCKKSGYRVVVSHRSGETNDTFIADLAVGVAADGFKAGAPVRGERVTKYNRLMEIEELL